MATITKLSLGWKDGRMEYKTCENGFPSLGWRMEKSFFGVFFELRMEGWRKDGNPCEKSPKAVPT